jgi:hypothetical protein
MFAIHREANVTQTAGQDVTHFHRAILSVGRMGVLGRARSNPSAVDGTADSRGTNANPSDRRRDNPNLTGGDFTAAEVPDVGVTAFSE